MNKKEITLLNEVIKENTISYYYNNTPENYSILKGIEYTCKALNFPEYYIIVNETIILELKLNNNISFISAKMLLELMESISKYIPITDTIKDNNINEFISILEGLNDEIEYINKDTFTANVNKIRYIKRVD